MGVWLGEHLGSMTIEMHGTSTVVGLLERFLADSADSARRDLGGNRDPAIGWTRWAVDPVYRLVTENSYRHVWFSGTADRTHRDDDPFAWGTPDSARVLERCEHCSKFSCLPYFTPRPAFLGIVCGWGRVDLREHGWESTKAWPLAVWSFCERCAHNHGRFREAETVFLHPGGQDSCWHFGRALCDDHSRDFRNDLCPALSARDLVRAVRRLYGLPEVDRIPLSHAALSTGFR